MSCTPTSSVARSLSPSDESRFVPRSSVAASMMERYFTSASKQEVGGEEKVDAQEGDAGVDKPAAVGDAARDQEPSGEEPAVVEDEDEKSGILGATICFTPENSPRSTPNRPTLKVDVPNLDSLNSNSNEYIGSIVAAGSGDAGMSKMGSSAMHVASSLDGRSTTEYEILSKGSIEVEDLSSDAGNDATGVPNVLSPMSTLPSLGGDGGDDISLDVGSPLKLPKTSQPDATKATHVSGDEPLVSLSTTEPLKMNLSSVLKLDVSSDEDTAVKEEANDAESPPDTPKEDESPPDTPSPKVDERPLTPFSTVKKFWEGQSDTIARATKSVFGRILAETKDVESQGVETADDNRDADADAPQDETASKSKGTGDFETPADAKSTKPADSNAIELVNSIELMSQKFAPPLSKIKEALFAMAFSANEFVVAAFHATIALLTLLGLIIYVPTSTTIALAKVLFSWVLGMAKVLFARVVYEPASTVIGMSKVMFARVLRRKMAIEEGTAHEDVKDAAKPADGPEDAPEHTGTNLSALFSEEASEEKPGSLEKPTLEVGEYKGSGDVDLSTATATALDPKEKALFNRIKGKISGSMAFKFDKAALSFLKPTRVRYAIASCVLISVILMSGYMLKAGVEVIQERSGVVQEEPMTVPSLEEADLNYNSTDATSFISTPVLEADLVPDPHGSEVQEESTSTSSLEEEEPTRTLSQDEHKNIPEEGDICCISTHTTSFVSIQAWELNLSPASFGSEEDNGEAGGTDDARPRSWLLFVGSSITLFCAFVFHSKISYPFSKSKGGIKMLTGTWSEEEHQQFMRGYNEHGNRWKLVSEFVPTRTYTQVKGHASSWKQIGSPQKMKRSRKTNTPTQANARATPKTPSSASSSVSTPRQSNKSRPTPLRGILAESQLDRNVTPRSEGRTRRMKQMKAAKSQSDPGKKKVRIRDP